MNGEKLSFQGYPSLLFFVLMTTPTPLSKYATFSRTRYQYVSMCIDEEMPYLESDVSEVST